MANDEFLKEITNMSVCQVVIDIQHITYSRRWPTQVQFREADRVEYQPVNQEMYCCGHGQQ